ncbi:MAG: hypothetical protein ACI9LM_001362 [Alteromonadaceae bacterium]|jgi:hypothetical protein
MYYPILRWKKGEQLAISNLFEDDAKYMTPIWWLTEHEDVSKLTLELENVWSEFSIADLSRIDGVNKLLPQVDALLNTKNIDVMVSPDQLQNLDKDFRKKNASSISIRINVADQSTGVDAGKHQAIINSLNNFSDLVEDELLILFDYGALSDFDNSEVRNIANCIELYLSEGYENLIFSSGAFPASLASIVGTEFVSREDKRLHAELTELLEHDLLYSDYGAFSPSWDPSAKGIPLANLRFALDEQWMIIRDAKRGKDASCAVATLLVMSEEFEDYGEDFSWADKRWQIKADTSENPGGPTQHIAEAHNHHMTHVVNKD